MPPLQWSPEHLHSKGDSSSMKGSKESRQHSTQDGSTHSRLVTMSSSLRSYFKDQINIRYLSDHPCPLHAHRELFHSRIFSLSTRSDMALVRPSKTENFISKRVQPLFRIFRHLLSPLQVY